MKTNLNFSRFDFSYMKSYLPQMVVSNICKKCGREHLTNQRVCPACIADYQGELQRDASEDQAASKFDKLKQIFFFLFLTAGAIRAFSIANALRGSNHFAAWTFAVIGSGCALLSLFLVLIAIFVKK